MRQRHRFIREKKKEKEAKVSIDSERQKDKYVDKRRATLCNVRAHREREIERTID